jgi:predicted nuclease of predicted toxin-antitoxin system
MMQFRVDENLRDDIAEALRSRGHDTLTVHDQGMRGNPDTRLALVCRADGRAIVTLDLDFANIRDYPPQDYPGLIVLRLADQSRPYVLRVFRSVLDLLDREVLAGCLWIVEEHRVRIRRADGTGPP